MRKAPKRMFPNGLKTIANRLVPGETFTGIETTMLQKNKLMRGVTKKTRGYVEKSYYDHGTGKVETVRVREERPEKQTFRNRGF